MPTTPTPSITSWMRLEPRSRNSEMNDSLQARIYDPLWLLARQWQLGEFQGEDNGSPIIASWRAETARLTRYHSGAILPNTMVNAPSYDTNRIPLESLVERERIRPTTDQAARPEKLKLAAEAGQQFLRMLQSKPLSRDYRSAFISQHPFPVLTPEQRAAVDSDSLGFLDVMAARVPDGRRLYAALRPAGSTGVVIAPALQIAAVDLAQVENIARLWVQWFETLFSEPDTPNPSWSPERMEYAFSVGSRFSDGELSGHDRLASYITPDLATIYEVEHGIVSVSGGPVTGWVLRTTTTFRREDGTWKVVHRHADPINTANPQGPLRTT